jgi:diguanylate cyclase (GGDEF)-like protein/PAS domain S-box-containing protein
VNIRYLPLGSVVGTEDNPAEPLHVEANVKVQVATPATPVDAAGDPVDAGGGWIQGLDTQVGTAVALTAIGAVTAYALLSWDQPHRWTLLMMVTVALPLSQVKPKVAPFGSVAHAEAVTIASSIAFVAMVAAGCALDGGAGSPLCVLFFISVAYATLAYPLGAAIGVVALAMICFLGLAVVEGEALASAIVTAIALGCTGAIGRRSTQREARRRADLAARGESLRRSEQRFRAGFDDTPVGTAMIGPDGRFLEVNGALCRLLGRPQEWLLAHTRWDVTHPDDAVGVQTTTADTVNRGQRENRYIRADGNVLHVLVAEAALRGADGSINDLYLHVVDITALREVTQLALRQTRQQTALAAISQAALAGGPNSTTFETCVEVMHDTLDVEFAEVIEVLPDGGTHRRAVRDDDGGDAAESANAAASLRDYTMWLRRPVVMSAAALEGRFPADGLLRRGIVGALSVPVPLPVGVPWGVLVAGSHRPGHFADEDIDFMLALAAVLAAALARQEAETRLRRASLRDVLTGLPNRDLLLDQLQHALSQRRPTIAPPAVMFLDIENLKAVDEAFGQEIGNRLLRAVATRLGETLGPRDTLARFDGDTFVLLCDGFERPELANAQTDRILAAFAQPFVVDDGGRETVEYRAKVTIGVGIASGDRDQDSNTLLRDAETAHRRAKESRSPVEFFDEVSRARVLHRMRTTAALHQAIEAHQLRPAYQPIVSLRDGTIRKAEALLRWHDPQRGTILPGDFIPVAEESELILAIGDQLVGDVCDQLARWDASPDPRMQGLQVAVNFSARQLVEPALPEKVLAALESRGLAPSRIVCEITETALIEDPERAVKTVEALSSAGIEISLDDFCTGYSALVHLKRFPLSTIKVDRTFTAGLPTEVTDTAIVGGLIDMAKAMGLEIVAEGVETHTQLDALRHLDAHFGQGWRFAPALKPEQLEAFICENNGRVDLDAA